jgi:hypothetical protein
VVTQISRIHIFPNVWAVQDSDSRKEHETVQGQSPGINQPQAG